MYQTTLESKYGELNIEFDVEELEVTNDTYRATDESTTCVIDILREYDLLKPEFDELLLARAKETDEQGKITLFEDLAYALSPPSLDDKQAPDESIVSQVEDEYFANFTGIKREALS